MDNVTIQYSNGDTLVARGLAQFTISTLSREYFVYSLNEHSDGDLIKTYIACISDDGVINDKEWDTIKKYLSKMTHSEDIPELSFVNFEGKIVKLSEIHPKKIALKASQIDGIVKYQKERVLEGLRNDDTSIMGETDESKKDRKSFIDSDLLVKEEEEQNVDMGINIFNTPLKPEFNVQEEQASQEEKTDNVEETTVVEESKPVEESAFIATPINEIEKKDEEIINVSNQIQDLRNKFNERSDSMLQTEKEQIMSALNKAGDALSEATAAVESAKALLERVNTNDNIVQNTAQDELQGAVIDMSSMISEPAPTVETPAFEPQVPTQEVNSVNEAPAFEPQPVAEVQPVVQNAEPQPIAEAQTVVQNAEPQPIAEVQPVVQNATPQPIAEVQPIVQNAEPQPIAEVQTVVQNAEPQPIVEVQTVVQNAEPQPIEQVQPMVQNAEPQPVEQVQQVVQPTEPLFGTPDTPYVEPNYSEVPPTMPNDLVSQPQPEMQVYGPGSLDAGVQETGGMQRQLVA